MREDKILRGSVTYMREAGARARMDEDAEEVDPCVRERERERKGG